MALDLLESFATMMLRGIGETTKLRGAETVIVGIQPNVAFAMVQLGLTFNRVATGLDLQEGSTVWQCSSKRSLIVAAESNRIIVASDGNVVAAR